MTNLQKICLSETATVVKKITDVIVKDADDDEKCLEQLLQTFDWAKNEVRAILSEGNHETA